MNNIFKTTARLALGLVIISSVLTSCKKDEDPVDCTPDPEVKSVSLHFHHMYAGEEFGLDSPYTIAGVDVKFQRISYFLSNFVFMDDVSNMEMMDGEVILVSAVDTQSETIGITDLDHLHMMSFVLGLDSLTNETNLITADAPLNDPDMYWNWDTENGYKYVRVDGERDLDGDGTYEPFAIHVATPAMMRTIENLMVHEDVASDGVAIHMSVDYNKFFENVDFSSEVLEGTHGNGLVTNQVADGADDAFTIE